jgi:hypothetical protein
MDMGYRILAWASSASLAAIPVVFGVALNTGLPAWWGWGLLLSVPFLATLLFIGVVGRGSPHDEHPNPLEIFARGGRT